jgi:hypothetical protein
VWPMPRFYIDTDDGTTTVRDIVGLELDGAETARSEALRALPGITRDVFPDGEKLIVTVLVREMDGAQLFRASLTFRCEWVG